MEIRQAKRTCPDMPCQSCVRQGNCRLKLNCERYLRYLSQKAQMEEDALELRRCKMGGGAAADELRVKAVMRRYRALAKAVPWRQGGVQHAEKG